MLSAIKAKIAHTHLSSSPSLPQVSYRLTFFVFCKNHAHCSAFIRYALGPVLTRDGGPLCGTIRLGWDVCFGIGDECVHVVGSFLQCYLPPPPCAHHRCSFFPSCFFPLSSLILLLSVFYTFISPLPNFNLHLPPYPTTDSMDDVIKIHDPALHQHLEVVGISSGFLGWSLLKTMFSQILGIYVIIIKYSAFMLFLSNNRHLCHSHDLFCRHNVILKWGLRSIFVFHRILHTVISKDLWCENVILFLPHFVWFNL